MKKRSLLKGFCAAIVSSLLATVLPMGVMADDAVTVTANYDTYIDTGKADDNSLSSAGSLNFQYRGKNVRRALIGFNLDSLNMPADKQVESAKITVYLSSYFNYNAPIPEGSSYSRVAGDASCYAYTTPVDYIGTESEPAVITWNSMVDNSLVKAGDNSTVTLCADNTFEAYTPYEFDITGYLADRTTLTGNELFAINIDDNGIAGGFASAEDANNKDGMYTAKLSVTFKDYVKPNYQIIKANADTYIEQNNNMTDPTGSNYQNFIDSEVLKFQRNGNWAREAMVRFPLDEIVIPEGKQIDTATVTMYLEGFFNNNKDINNGNDKTAAPINMYTIKSEDYDPATITWVNAPGPVRGGSIAVTTLCPDNTLNKGDAYTFDITDYISSKAYFDGNETFVFYPEAYYNVSGSFYSMEAANGAYTPELKVTFKDIEDQTIKALDTAYVRQDDYVKDDGSLNIGDNSAETYPIQNNGISKSNRIGFYTFDLGEIVIPEGKVITEATLKLYVSMNYDKTPVAMRIFNIADDNWTSDSLAADTAVEDGVNVVTATSWDKVSYAEQIRSGLGTDAGISSVSTIPYVDSTSINQWIDFDVTEYLTNQYYKDPDMLVSFAAYPETKRTSGAVHIASNNMSGCEPKLFVKFGEEAEIEIGKPVFHGTFNADTVDTVKHTGRSAITIPIDGASATPTDVDVYVAQYEEGTDRLVGVSLYRNMSIYSAKDGINFGYFPEGWSKQCYVKAFVWDTNASAYIGATQIAMEAPPVVEEE